MSGLGLGNLNEKYEKEYCTWESAYNSKPPPLSTNKKVYSLKQLLPRQWRYQWCRLLRLLCLGTRLLPKELPSPGRHIPSHRWSWCHGSPSVWSESAAPPNDGRVPSPWPLPYWVQCQMEAKGNARLAEQMDSVSRLCRQGRLPSSP